MLKFQDFFERKKDFLNLATKPILSRQMSTYRHRSISIGRPSEIPKSPTSPLPPKSSKKISKISEKKIQKKHEIDNTNPFSNGNTSKKSSLMNNIMNIRKKLASCEQKMGEIFDFEGNKENQIIDYNRESYSKHTESIGLKYGLGSLRSNYMTRDESGSKYQNYLK